MVGVTSCKSWIIIIQSSFNFQSTSNPPPEVDWIQCALNFKWIHVNVTNRIGCAFDAHSMRITVSIWTGYKTASLLTITYFLSFEQDNWFIKRIQIKLIFCCVEENWWSHWLISYYFIFGIIELSLVSPPPCQVLLFLIVFIPGITFNLTPALLSCFPESYSTQLSCKLLMNICNYEILVVVA